MLWRLYRAEYGPGLDGIGGTFASGRWHSRGERVVYLGATAAIVVLERLAHTDPEFLPSDLRLACFQFLQDVPVTPVEEFGELPADWVAREDDTRRMGGAWRHAKVSCLLRVPSAVLPEEWNFVLDPEHPDARLLKQVRERPFAFDPRLV